MRVSTVAIWVNLSSLASACAQLDQEFTPGVDTEQIKWLIHTWMSCGLLGRGLGWLLAPLLLFLSPPWVLYDGGERLGVWAAGDSWPWFPWVPTITMERPSSGPWSSVGSSIIILSVSSSPRVSREITAQTDWHWETSLARKIYNWVTLFRVDIDSGAVNTSYYLWRCPAPHWGCCGAGPPAGVEAGRSELILVEGSRKPAGSVWPGGDRKQIIWHYGSGRAQFQTHSSF